MMFYKTFCRPTLYYGFEILNFTGQQIKKLQTLESTLLKRMLKLRKTSRSTRLLKALRIETAKDRLLKIKNSFLLQLLKNPFTHKILEELCKNLKTKKLHKKSYLHQLNLLNNETHEEIDDFSGTANQAIKEINQNLNLNFKNETEIVNILKNMTINQLLLN